MTPAATTKAAPTPTGVLSAEHRNIEKALAALDAMASSFEEAGAIEAGPAGEALAFLREYADRLHHGKEEANLFPAMERRGIPAEVSPTAVMRQEHETGRATIRSMGAAVDAGDAAAFAAMARAYVALLREHILKEDQVLFPMADGLIPADEQAELSRIFERVETLEVGRERVAALLASVDGLCARYGVTEVPRGRGGSACSACCGH